MPFRLRVAACLCSLLSVLTGPVSAGQAIDIVARPIETFRVGSAETRFGPFEFAGGLELASSSRDLGAMSSIRYDGDENGFIGVMDTGKWFSGRIKRDASGRMTGLSDFVVTVMRDRAGAEEDRKWLVDAEGLAIGGGDLLVSFEREHRVDVYRKSDLPDGAAVASLPVLIPMHEFRGNRGIETVAVAPGGGPLAGAPVIVTERSVNPAGDIFAAVLDGPRKGVFFVRRDPPFDVTDGAFLPDGDLLLLERRFSIAGGIGMRIRRIETATIAPGETVDGEILLEGDFGYQIDNMEGLDVIEAVDGTVSVLLVSDDNHSILQRNLLLEFRLVE